MEIAAANILSGNFRTIARAISMIENEVDGFETLLTTLNPVHTKNIIGITGPPGAGKSTIVDQLISQFVDKSQRVAVLCVDPSSPFNLGALLGDRIRMSQWYNHPDVYIRSLASRASLGGLHPSIVEIILLLQAAPFDWIIIETVGVGQSEVDIAALADTRVVVLVPEAGDDIQSMKSGLMEIADIFAINKSDRPDADKFARTLEAMLHHRLDAGSIPDVLKLVGTTGEGIDHLYESILSRTANQPSPAGLMTERAYQLIQKMRMKGIQKGVIKSAIDEALKDGNFNFYTFVKTFESQH